ncbi:MAG: hypothetical protein V1726_00035 [Methanobacteriota archaeon]
MRQTLNMKKWSGWLSGLPYMLVERADEESSIKAYSGKIAF